MVGITEVIPERLLWAQMIHSLQALLFLQFRKVNFYQIFGRHLYHTSLMSDDKLMLRCHQLNPSLGVTLYSLRQVSQLPVDLVSSSVTWNS